MRILLLCLAIGAVGCKKHESEQPMAALVAKCGGGDAELACPKPILSVANLHASQRYYRDQLGFKIDWDHGDPPDFGSVSRGDTQIFMCQRCQGHFGGWMWVFAKNVDKLHEELRGRGAIIKMPPTNMEWGAREMHVADPDGNVIRFASPIDHDDAH
jgi:catechol 2,3-dioxygenase-like lactoylglutathione lyase family enzyme